MSYEIGLATPGTPNRGFPLWICSVLMVILAGIFVLLRLVIRFHRGRLGCDDWTILASLICSVLLTITECSAVHNGYGKHASDLSHDEQIRALKWFFGAQVMYKVVITVNKVSFFCLYLRIFIMPTFRRICFIGIGVITSWGLAYVLVTIFQCKPMASFWDKRIKTPECLDNEAMWMSYSVMNIIFDLIILTLPIKSIRQLRLPKAKKIGLLVIFAMGTFVCVTTIIRTTTLVSSAADKDSTSGPIPATIWSVIEANTGIICTCLPVFKHPLQMFFPNLFYSQHHTDPYSRSAPYRTPLTSSSQRNLHDGHDEIPQDDAVKGFEMLTPRSQEDVAKSRITMFTDSKITYGKDQTSIASAAPTGAREFQ